MLVKPHQHAARNLLTITQTKTAHQTVRDSMARHRLPCCLVLIFNNIYTTPIGGATVAMYFPQCWPTSHPYVMLHVCWHCELMRLSQDTDAGTIDHALVRQWSYELPRQTFACLQGTTPQAPHILTPSLWQDCYDSTASIVCTLTYGDETQHNHLKNTRKLTHP